MDINLTQLAQLIAIAEQANIEELEISEGSHSIRITCRSPNAGLGGQAHRLHKTTSLSHPDLQGNGTPLTSPVLFSKSVKPATQLPANPATASTLPSPAKSAETQLNQATQATQVTQATKTVTSPMVGTFYRKSSPDAPVFIEVGQSVVVGDTLCIIEAMKIMHEVKAEQAGVVQAILLNDGDMVEYDQPILTIE